MSDLSSRSKLETLSISLYAGLTNKFFVFNKAFHYMPKFPKLKILIFFVYWILSLSFSNLNSENLTLFSRI